MSMYSVSMLICSGGDAPPGMLLPPGPFSYRFCALSLGYMAGPPRANTVVIHKTGLFFSLHFERISGRVGSESSASVGGRGMRTMS